jgi:hypothetical protein
LVDSNVVVALVVVVCVRRRDIKQGWPNPARWGTPYAYFALGPECPATHFRNHTMTINLTFCGDWAGSVWTDEADCKNLAATCNDFVGQKPSVRDLTTQALSCVLV